MPVQNENICIHSVQILLDNLFDWFHMCVLVSTNDKSLHVLNLAGFMSILQYFILSFFLENSSYRFSRASKYYLFHQTGDDVWRYVGKLSDAQRSMLDDRFKWKVCSTSNLHILLFLVQSYSNYLLRLRHLSYCI